MKDKNALVSVVLLLLLAALTWFSEPVWRLLAVFAFGLSAVGVAAPGGRC